MKVSDTIVISNVHHYLKPVETSRFCYLYLCTESFYQIFIHYPIGSGKEGQDVRNKISSVERVGVNPVSTLRVAKENLTHSSSFNLLFQSIKSPARSISSLNKEFVHKKTTLSFPVRECQTKDDSRSPEDSLSLLVKVPDLMISNREQDEPSRIRSEERFIQGRFRLGYYRSQLGAFPFRASGTLTRDHTG